MNPQSNRRWPARPMGRSRFNALSYFAERRDLTDSEREEREEIAFKLHLASQLRGRPAIATRGRPS